jgi:hypothetical protein
MDTERNDAISGSLTVLPSRRDVLHELAGAGLGLAALLVWPHGESDIAAKTKGKTKHKRKRHKQPPRIAAEASRGWCRSDPFIAVDGVVVDIFCTAPLEAPLYVTGPTEIVVSVPVGVSAALVVAGVGFGRGEVVRFEEKSRLKHLADGLELEVGVYVPANRQLPIGVELARNLVGILTPTTAEGVTNQWITLPKRLPIETLLTQ